MVDYSGRRIRQFRLNRLIGSGGFATVYEATDMHLKRTVAIKMLHSWLVQEYAQDFLREARIMANMDHPHIVKVFEFDQYDNVPYLVMNYAPHGSMRQQFPYGETLPPDIVVRYVFQIEKALTYMHSCGVVHQDVKPENMVIGRRGEILLTDFGIAIRIAAANTSNSHVSIGTATHMAPERFDGVIHPASDQYSLAVCVYEWLTGEALFYGSSHQIARQQIYAAPQLLRDINPNISVAVEKVVLKGLAKDMQNRFVDVREFALALEKAVDVSKPSKGRKKMNRKRSLWQEILAMFAVSVLASSLLGFGLTLLGVLPSMALPVAEVCSLIVPLLSAWTRKNRPALKLSFSMLTLSTIVGVLLRSWAAFGWTSAILLFVSLYIIFVHTYHE